MVKLAWPVKASLIEIDIVAYHLIQKTYDWLAQKSPKIVNSFCRDSSDPNWRSSSGKGLGQIICFPLPVYSIRLRLLHLERTRTTRVFGRSIWSLSILSFIEASRVQFSTGKLHEGKSVCSQPFPHLHAVPQLNFALSSNTCTQYLMAAIKKSIPDDSVTDLLP